MKPPGTTERAPFVPGASFSWWLFAWVLVGTAKATHRRLIEVELCENGDGENVTKKYPDEDSCERKFGEGVCTITEDICGEDGDVECDSRELCEAQKAPSPEPKADEGPNVLGSAAEENCLTWGYSGQGKSRKWSSDENCYGEWTAPWKRGCVVSELVGIPEGAEIGIKTPPPFEKYEKDITSYDSDEDKHTKMKYMHRELVYIKREAYLAGDAICKDGAWLPPSLNCYACAASSGDDHKHCYHVDEIGCIADEDDGFGGVCQWKNNPGLCLKPSNTPAIATTLAIAIILLLTVAYVFYRVRGINYPDISGRWMINTDASGDAQNVLYVEVSQNTRKDICGGGKGSNFEIFVVRDNTSETSEAVKGSVTGGGPCCEATLDGGVIGSGFLNHRNNMMRVLMWRDPDDLPQDFSYVKQHLARILEAEYVDNMIRWDDRSLWRRVGDSARLPQPTLDLDAKEESNSRQARREAGDATLDVRSSNPKAGAPTLTTPPDAPPTRRDSGHSDVSDRVAADHNL